RELGRAQCRNQTVAVEEDDIVLLCHLCAHLWLQVVHAVAINGVGWGVVFT
ncbi:MAG: hypothetical protein ACI83P_001359, partial [Janthinobacterium sp.]